MKKKDHSPVGGYSFGNKKQYRRTLWHFVDDCLDRPARHRVAVYLDTSEGLETRFLLSRGYSPENLHAVNWNPAEVAVLTKNLARDGVRIKTHGVEAFRAIRDAAKVAPIDVINLDLCGPVSVSLMENLSALRDSLHETMVAVTVLRGREQGEVRDAITQANERQSRGDVDDEVGLRMAAASAAGHASETDVVRVRAILYSIIGDWNDATGPEDLAWMESWRWGKYRSSAGSQTMLWVVGHFRTARRLREIADADRSRRITAIDRIHTAMQPLVHELARLAVHHNQQPSESLLRAMLRLRSKIEIHQNALMAELGSMGESLCESAVEASRAIGPVDWTSIDAVNAACAQAEIRLKENGAAVKSDEDATKDLIGNLTAGMGQLI